MSKMSVAALGHVIAVERLDDLGVLAKGAADGVLGRVVPLADHFLQLGAEATVVEHLDVGGEDGGRVFAELLGDAVAMPLDFAGGGFEWPG